MKKIAVALICMIMVVGAAMAQPEKSFTFGPKIGVDYTHYWGKDCHHSGQFNYQGGVFFEYRIADRFAVAPEIVFAAQGNKWSDNYDIYDMETGYVIGEAKYSQTEHVNYINVPVMLKYYVAPSLSIDLGPQVGYCIYSKCSVDDDGVKYTYDQKDDTKKVDVGIGLGLTYNIAKDVFVQGRYTMGLTKVFKGGEAKNGNAQIAIGYRF
ncbi:MAG: PorT family protein [Muribaculaceae bacterium]|nr:PorT family protein [Muribaculaceae bacterium]